MPDQRDIYTEIINSAMHGLLEDHPRFKGLESYFLNQLDRKGLKEKIGEINATIEQYGSDVSDQDKIRYIQKEIEGYLPNALNEGSKEMLFKKSLEKKASKFFGFNARKVLGREDDLDRTLAAADEIFTLVSSNETYAKLMPELVQKAAEVKQMGFLTPVINVLESYGMIDKSEGSSLYQRASERIKRGGEQLRQMPSAYIDRAEQSDPSYAQKAAAVLAMISVGLLVLSGINLTGGVTGIAIGKNLTFMLIGSVSFLSAVGLFLFSFRKNNKQANLKNSKKKR